MAKIAMFNNHVWRKGRLGKTGDSPQIIFAQVREDADVELKLLRLRPEGESVFCIASGGCTAFSLLAARPAKLQIVDINPAQVFLVELKKAALLHLSYAEMMSTLMRDARPSYAFLRPHLSPEAQQFWDSQPHLLARGLHQCGVIERRLKQVMFCLPFVQSRRNVRRLFGARSLRDQRRAYKNLWNHWRWKWAFQIVLSKPVLKMVYGEDFVRAVPPQFALQMKQRLDDTLLRHPLWRNGYLWQTFRGRYPKNDVALPPYLQIENHPIIVDGLSQTLLECADAMSALEACAPNSIGFFALSNILEITSAEYSHRLLQAVARAAKPGASVCLRSIFPFNEAIIEGAFDDSDVGFEYSSHEELERSDRSFFCTNLRVLKIIKD